MKSIIDKEWDILILLDACRYDYFKKLYPSYFNGKLTKIESIGNSTQVWHQQNFGNRDCSEIVYITPIIIFTKWLPDYNFHEVVMSWETHWDKGYGQVMPEGTTDVANEAIKKYPDKRIIVHFMQPHIPYISYKPTGKQKKIPSKIKTKNRKTFRYYMSKKLAQYSVPNNWQWTITNLLGKNSYAGNIYSNGGWEEIRRAYEETLKYTLFNIHDLLSVTDKKIVITADHGERLGEKGLFGHSQKRRDKCVVEIPWFEVDKKGDNNE